MAAVDSAGLSAALNTNKVKGRKPKPVQIQIAEGDPRKHGVHKLQERLNAEPKATRGLPDCPRHLKGRARAAWNTWKSEAEAMDIDRRPDAAMLEGACVHYARAVEADIILARDGITVEQSTIGADGERIVLRIKKHPAVEVSNQAWRQVRSFCTEFGFSPSSRTRVHSEKQTEAVDDLAILLNSPRPAKQQQPVQ